MADSLDVFMGVLLTAIGLVVVYGSIVYRLIDLIFILGVLITLFGLYKLIPAFVSRIFDSRRGSSNLGFLNNSKSKSKGGQTTLTSFNNQSHSSSMDYIKKGAKEINDRIQDNKKDTNFKTVLKTPDNYYDENDIFNAPNIADENVEYAYNYANDRGSVADYSIGNIFNSRTDINSKSEVSSAKVAYFLDNQNSGNSNQVFFTPNYEKPMKVTRRPTRKSEELINLNEVPKRSQEISQALANADLSNGPLDINEDNYSISPKTLEDDVIIPIRDFGYDEDEATFNSLSFENTNNVVIEEESDDIDLDFGDYITPIHNDDVQNYESSVEFLNKVDNYDSWNLNQNGSIEDNVSDDVDGNVDDLNQFDDIGSVVGDGADDIGSVVGDGADDFGSVDSGDDLISESYSNENTLALDNIESIRKTLPRPTSVASANPIPSKKSIENIESDNSNLKRPIQINPNNPESLPIPKLLKSYVICDRGILTSQEAFEEVAKHSKEELLLEAPSIKDMGEVFLSNLSKIPSRVLIQDIDLEDDSYISLLSSLIDKGVQIKTLVLVNSFNLVGDDSYALLISNAVDDDSVEYGAVYNDEDSINNIKELFESSWNLANDLEIGVNT